MLQDTDCHKTMINSPPTYTKVMVALGGNVSSRVGSPVSTLRCAIERLSDSHLQVDKISQFYATPCFPAGSGPDYVNATATFAGSSDPASGSEQFCIRLKLNLAESGTVRWGQRTLDLDLIAIGDQVLPGCTATHNGAWVGLPLEQQMQEAPDQLILPHPRHSGSRLCAWCRLQRSRPIGCIRFRSLSVLAKCSNALPARSKGRDQAARVSRLGHHWSMVGRSQFWVRKLSNRRHSTRVRST